jgi:hypothetical protein
MQALADVQDTPFKRLPSAPEGLGVVSIDHALPFHASARVSSAPELSSYAPTAVQALVEVQDTP